VDLTTAARARQLIEFASGSNIVTDATFTTWLGNTITSWSKRAETLMARKVTTATYTEFLDVDRGQRVFSLKAFPVSSISSVQSDYARAFTATAISSSLYSCQTGTGLLRLDQYDPDSGPGSLKVIYRGGMAPSAASFVTAFPEIAEAIDQQVQYAFTRRKNPGRTAVSVGQDSVNYLGPVDWLPHVKSVLMSHRRVYVA